MADNTTILGKSIFVGATEHLRDSNFEEYLCEGVIFVGDSLTKGSAETQVIAHPGGDQEFKGIAVGHSIRQSDLETFGVPGDDRDDAIADLIESAGGLLSPGQMIKVFIGSGKQTKIRTMFHGFTTGVTLESGAPVYYKSTGSTIGSTLSADGNLFGDPACTDDATIVGRTAGAIVLPDATTNDVNVEGEWWF